MSSTLSSIHALIVCLEDFAAVLAKASVTTAALLNDKPRFFVVGYVVQCKTVHATTRTCIRFKDTRWFDMMAAIIGNGLIHLCEAASCCKVLVSQAAQASVAEDTTQKPADIFLRVAHTYQISTIPKFAVKLGVCRSDVVVCIEALTLTILLQLCPSFILRSDQ